MCCNWLKYILNTMKNIHILWFIAWFIKIYFIEFGELIQIGQKYRNIEIMSTSYFYLILCKAVDRK